MTQNTPHKLILTITGFLLKISVTVDRNYGEHQKSSPIVPISFFFLYKFSLVKLRSVFNAPVINIELTN